jgi:hypothetical protein
MERSKQNRARVAGRRTITVGAVLALACAGIALAASATQYGGTTAQKVGKTPFRITLVVSHGKLTSVAVGALLKRGPASCSPAFVGGREFTFTKGKVKLAHGKLKGKLSDSAGDSLTINARLKGKKLSGSLTVQTTRKDVGIPSCNSGAVKFSAEAAGGEPGGARFAGSSGGGYPLSFRVSADGKSVLGLTAAYDETCNGAPGNTAPTFHFKTLAIKSGSFSGTASIGLGSTVSQSLKISGSFFGDTASGTVTDTSHIKSLPDCSQSAPFTAKKQ